MTPGAACTWPTSTTPPARDVLDGTDLTITGVAFAGSGMLALGGSDGSLRLWHPSRRAMQMIRTAGSAVTAVAASPNGARLVISDRRSELSSFDAVNGSLEPGWAVELGPAGECLAFRADGTRLATAGDAVRIWNAADGTQAGVLPGRTGRARAVAADHDGNRIAAAWAEPVVTVWEGKKLLWELTGHSGAVLTVAFGPRPGLLVSAGDDHTIRTWDLATGQEAACHSPLGYRVTVLAASRARADARGRLRRRHHPAVRGRPARDAARLDRRARAGRPCARDHRDELRRSRPLPGHAPAGTGPRGSGTWPPARRRPCCCPGRPPLLPPTGPGAASARPTGSSGRRSA